MKTTPETAREFRIHEAIEALIVGVPNSILAASARGEVSLDAIARLAMANEGLDPDTGDRVDQSISPTSRPWTVRSIRTGELVCGRVPFDIAATIAARMNKEGSEVFAEMIIVEKGADHEDREIT